VSAGAHRRHELHWKELQMKKEDVFPARFLKASDLSGKPMVVTIEGTVREVLKTPDGKQQEKPVLYFTGMKKSLACNITNWDSVAEICGEDSDEWPGHQIELFPAKTQMGGRTVDCIRIRPPTPSGPQPKKPATPKPPKKGAAAAKHDEMADEIPFLK
jgi:hypothetical protein